MSDNSQDTPMGSSSVLQQESHKNISSGGRGRGRGPARPQRSGPHHDSNRLPNQHHHDRTAGAVAGSEDNHGMLKVSASSQSKSVAGAISHTCREHDAPSILAAGAAAINTAIKAIAIARMNLTEDNIELSCAPALTDKVSMGYKLSLTKSVKSIATVADQELKVGKNSNPGAIAGAIKGMLLERKRISLLAVGPDAVHHCIGAISLARIWLQAENSIDVSFRPEFFELELEHNGQISKASAVRINILSGDF